jgi:site-specific recombinase
MKKSRILIVLAVLLMFITAFFIGKNTKKCENVITSDTIVKIDTLWRDTIVKDTVLQPKYIKVLKRDTVFTSNGDTIELVKEAKTYDKRLTINQDTADLKIYVSGIETSLDSLKMRLKTHETIKTVEVIKLVEKPKTWKDRFDIGIGVGYGIGLNKKEFEPFLGVNFSYKL